MNFILFSGPIIDKCLGLKCGDTCDMSVFGVKYCNFNKECQLSPVPPNCEGINQFLDMDIAREPITHINQ